MKKQSCTHKHRSVVNKPTLHVGYQKQRGTSLLEMLIAFFVLAVGLLGMFAMQAQSIKYSTQSFTMSQAMLLANDMAEKIREDRENTSIASYKSTGFIAAPSAPVDTCETAACADAGKVTYNKNNWAYQLAESLPKGQGRILATADADVYEINIRFLSTTQNSELEKTLTDKDWNNYSLLVRI